MMTLVILFFVQTITLVESEDRHDVSMAECKKIRGRKAAETGHVYFLKSHPLSKGQTLRTKSHKKGKRWRD